MGHCASGSQCTIIMKDYSEENVRKMDNLMTDALTIGAQQEQQYIDAEIIMAVANNQSLT